MYSEDKKDEGRITRTEMIIVMMRIICEDNEDGDGYIDRSPRRLAAKLIRETPTMTKSSQHLRCSNV